MIFFDVVRGLLLGLSIAAPVGPIGVLTIRRTLAEGRVRGFVTGLGAATADATYGAVAAFGLTAISGALMAQRVWIHLIGAAFLFYLGFRTALATPAPLVVEGTTSRGHISAYVSTLFLTLANPATIFSFLAVFAGIGLVGAHNGWLAATLTVVGVFLGSALWWLVLSGVVSAVRGRFTPTAMRWVNRVSGAILVGFAVVALLSLR